MSERLRRRLDIIDRTKRRLAAYFDRDEEQRFGMENVVGGGVAGLTWKIRYAASPGQYRYIVLKTDRYYSHVDDGTTADQIFDRESSIVVEKNHLDTLQWAKHIVNEVVIKGDPLARNFTGIHSHYMQMGHWIYLEWLENGTVETMVRRAIEYDIRLSNRFLWRVFLCLIRMCIAMGWPPRKPQGHDPQPVIEKASGGARTGLQHRDMHDGNLMFGSLSPDDSDGEHSVVPILKLIDFGGMNDDSDDDAHLMNVSVTENLFDVGRMMVELVTLDKEAGYAIYPSIGEAQLFRIATNSPVALTNGVILLPDEDGNNPFPYLDTNLRGLICACLAPEPGGRPRAGRLANAVLTAVKWRDESFYVSQGIPDESDDNLQSIVNQLLFDVS